MDATITQAAQSAANNTATQTATESTQNQAAIQEVIPLSAEYNPGTSTPSTTMVGASSEPGANIAETAPTQADSSLTDTQKDIQKIKQAISDLEKLGETLVGDELAALKAKLVTLEEKAKQEAEELVQETEEEIQSLADQFYAKTGIRPWGLVIVTALYIAVKVAGIIFPWLK